MRQTNIGGVEMKNKFIVIKTNDLTKYVGPSRRGFLSIILEDIQEGRKVEGKNVENKYLVVNKDEQYAGLVENLILNKVTTDDIPEDLKEKLLKEYTENLMEEFQQIQRFEGKITMKDIADILQV